MVILQVLTGHISGLLIVALSIGMIFVVQGCRCGCGSADVTGGLQAESLYERGELLYAEDFENDLSQWQAEQMAGGKAELRDGALWIDDKAGCTVWFKPPLDGPIIIEYEATTISQGGPNDRVSDLNCFWMATDPANEDLLAGGKERGGRFPNYHGLRLYYVGYGGNSNTTTRFRRYPGTGERPMLPEYDLGSPDVLLKANEKMHVQIVACGPVVRFSRDGKVIFDYRDADPLRSGWFGFRTVANRLKLESFRVYRLVPGPQITEIERELQSQ